MGTITKRKNKDGTIRYRSQIQINRDGIKHNESKTFSTKKLAQAWLKKREAEIELNPSILTDTPTKSMRLSEAIKKYHLETKGNFADSLGFNLNLLLNFDIANVKLDKLTAQHVTTFAHQRLNGLQEGYNPVKPQTLNADLVRIRAVLKQARYAWGCEVNLHNFEDAVQALRFTRKIKGSDKRYRTATADELQKLTTYFYAQFQSKANHYPMYLIMWLAIYTCRRQGELTRLRLDDYNDGWWLVRDSKSPKGSKGNHINTRISENAEKVIKELKKKKIREKMNFHKATCWNEDLLLPLSSDSISTRFTEACKVLGINDLRFHDLRHEGITRLAEKGLTIPQIQTYSGHRSWSALQIYVNITARQSVLEFDEAVEVAKSAWLDGRL